MNNRIRAKVTRVVKVYELDVAGNVGASADAVTRLREPLEYLPPSVRCRASPRALAPFSFCLYRRSASCMQPFWGDFDHALQPL